MGDLLMLGILFGAVGGAAAALNSIFNGFSSPDEAPSSVSKRAVKQRVGFFVMRMVLGAIFGVMATFWILGDNDTKDMSPFKIYVFAFSAGYTSSIINTIIKKVRDGFS